MGSRPILAPFKPWQCPNIPSPCALDAPSNLTWSSPHLSLCFQVLSSRGGSAVCQRLLGGLQHSLSPRQQLGIQTGSWYSRMPQKAFPFPISEATRGIHTSQTIQLSHLVPLNTMGSRKYLVNPGGLEQPYCLELLGSLWRKPCFAQDNPCS